MSQENVEVVEHAVAAINETYRTGDMRPWRRLVEAECDPEIVLDAPTDAFTEGEWRGHDGAVGFVANQMEVLDDMWLRVDDSGTGGGPRSRGAAGVGAASSAEPS